MTTPRTLPRVLIGLTTALAAGVAGITTAGTAYAGTRDGGSAHARRASACTVLVQTADRSRAGTDGDVWLSINGSTGSTGSLYLDDPNRDDFERGHLDQFHFAFLPDVGTMKSVDITFDSHGDSWYLDWVEVSCAGQAHFPYYGWVPEGGTTRVPAA